MKRFIAFSLLLCMGIVATGCGSQNAASSSAAPAASSEAASSSASAVEKVEWKKWEAGYLPQFNEPESGTPIVTLHTSMGDIKMMLFPQAAPKAVENFVTHCENGYYDNVTFHRVIEEFMIQGGDPLGNGTGGESIWDADFEDEFSDNLHNFRGALSMANAGYGTNGSQFFIVQHDAKQYPNSGMTVTPENRDNVMMMMLGNSEIYNGTMLMNERAAQPGVTNEEMQKYVGELNANIQAVMGAGVTDEVKARFSAAAEKYIEVGGAPNLDFKHTVFGQVLEGMDVVDAIARVEKNTADKPNTDVVIKSATVETAK
ncbi:MAG: peptidylprolyl isomerase [Oscillospiraceae bacterium]|nr:peptidylprolyl isomerase [Oscillospiraceae bacterium]